MFIKRIKKQFKPGEAIFAEDILSLFPEFSKAYVFRLVKKAEFKGDLIRFSRGVYCLPKQTMFGKTLMTSSQVANNKYVTNGDDVYGLFSGLTLLNQFAISTQVPNTLEIVTNNEATRKRVVDIDGMKFIVRKSRFEITKANYNYYTILQLFLELGSNISLDDFAKKRISEYISSNKLDTNTLIKLAMQFPAQALKNLIGSEILNGIL